MSITPEQQDQYLSDEDFAAIRSKLSPSQRQKVADDHGQWFVNVRRTHLAKKYTPRAVKL